MNPEPTDPPATPRDPAPPRRLFLREPGWRVALKVGSERMFCYMMAPGQDYYHRLLDGEVYVYNGDERICLACAVRRGLLSFEARGLGGGSSRSSTSTPRTARSSTSSPPLRQPGAVEGGGTDRRTVVVT